MKLNYNIISQKFGKYTDQFIEMMSWAMPPEFFVRNQQWIENNFKIDPYDFFVHADQAPKIHTPDRLELELISIRKHNNYIYQGQVLVNSQNFHGFGRILQYQDGKDSGNAYVYEGWFINGLPQGWGRKICQDGTVYLGQFRFGLENGKGIKVTKSIDTDNESEIQEKRQDGQCTYGIYASTIS